MSGSEDDDSYELEEHRLVADPAVPGRWASIERVLARGSPLANEGFVPDLNAVRYQYTHTQQCAPACRRAPPTHRSRNDFRTVVSCWSPLATHSDLWGA